MVFPFLFASHFLVSGMIVHLCLKSCSNQRVYMDICSTWVRTFSRDTPPGLLCGKQWLHIPNITYLFLKLFLEMVIIPFTIRSAHWTVSVVNFFVHYHFQNSSTYLFTDLMFYWFSVPIKESASEFSETIF